MLRRKIYDSVDHNLTYKGIGSRALWLIEMVHMAAAEFTRTKSPVQAAELFRFEMAKARIVRDMRHKKLANADSKISIWLCDFKAPKIEIMTRGPSQATAVATIVLTDTEALINGEPARKMVDLNRAKLVREIVADRMPKLGKLLVNSL